MIKMKLAVATLLLGMGTAALAQPGDYAQIQQQEARRSAPQNAEELAKQCNISQDAANQAWAVYTDYVSTMSAIRDKQREEMKALKSGDAKPTDAQVEEAFYNKLNTRRQAIDLEEENYKKLSSVLSPSQALKLMRSARQNMKTERISNQKMYKQVPPKNRE